MSIRQRERADDLSSVSRRSLLQGGAGIAAALTFGGVIAAHGSSKASATPLYSNGYGRAQGLITDTALESFNLGAMHAWKQLGSKYDHQDMAGGPQQQINQAESYGNLGINMTGSIFLEDSLYDTLSLILGKQGVYLHNFSSCGSMAIVA